MKFVVVFLVVLGTYHTCVGQSSGVYEPYDDLKFVCTGTTDTLSTARVQVLTFDKLPLMLTKAQKSLIASFTNDADNPCKYFIRLVTSLTDDGILYNDWIGVGFDVHPKSATKTRRNWVVGQCVSAIIERGNGVPDATERPLPYAYVGGVILTATSNGTSVEIRSPNCPYALNYTPGFRTGESKWGFFINDEISGRTKGMCGNADGRDLNDFSTCPDSNGNTEKVTEGSVEEKWNIIQKDCKSGRRLDQKFLDEGCNGP